MVMISIMVCVTLIMIGVTLIMLLVWLITNQSNNTSDLFSTEYVCKHVTAY